MKNLLRRAVATIAALVISGAGVLALAAPATAAPNGILWMASGVNPGSPTTNDSVSLWVHLQSNPTSACTAGEAPTVTWDDGAGRSGTLPAPRVDSGVTLAYSGVIGTFPAGTTNLTITASGGCAQPYDDDTPPSVTTTSFSVEAVEAPEPPYVDTRTITGTVSRVLDGVATPLVGAMVLLVGYSGGLNVEPYGTTETDADGHYTLSLLGDVGAPLVTVVVLPPDSDEVYYLEGSTAASGSALDQSSATILDTNSWDVSAAYDIYVDYGDTPEDETFAPPTGEGWAEIPTQNLTAGTSYDATFSTTVEWQWNWSQGGSIWVEGVLPAGLEAELLLSDSVDWAMPSLRIHGTPERDGTFEVALRASDGSQDSAIAVTFVVARPYCTEAWHAHDLFSNNVAWTGLCRFDATIDDAAMEHTSDAPDAVGAFAGIGEITINGHAIWAEEVDSYFDEFDNDWWVVTDRDVDAGDLLVDVVVQRVIRGSTAVWFVATYAAGTSTPASVPITFSGTLGSDADLRWFGGGNFWVSSDVPGRSRPVVLHATDGTLVHEDGDPSFQITSTGALTYYVGLVDYADCAFADTITNAAQAIPYLAAEFGTEFTLPGEQCVPLWGDYDDLAHVGEYYETTIRPTVDGPLWIFDEGGVLTADLTHLLPGLQAEIVDQDTPGVAPGLRIWGTPTEVGEVGLPVEVTDGEFTSGADFWLHVFAAAPVDPEKQMTLDLEAQIGDIVGGTEVTVTGGGLLVPATWDLTVRSTPQVIHNGLVFPGGTITTNVTIPTGLEAGWHSLTFTGTWFDGTPATSVLWFELDAAGRLVGTSLSAPSIPAASGPGSGAGALASTGSVPDGSAPRLALLLIVVGLGALVATQRRSRSMSMMDA